ncbi:MAG: ostA-like family protein, partial [Pseudomonadota bacterium]|nr:ostA-like family protein [Pseudomonadota bacterium]
MTAWFKDGQDTRELSRAEAEGNVVITTAEEKITGNKGIYQKDENKAEILGDVVITRGPNILKGTRAELDLLTNISRIFGGETSDGDTRVRGTFYPDSTDKKAAQ